MSATTEPPNRPRESGWVWVAVLATVAWIATLPVIALVAEPTPDAIVFAPPHKLMGLLDGSDTRIVELNSTYMVVRGTERGFIRALYANGAWLVLPAREGGCIALRMPSA